MSTHRILIVDDEEEFLLSLKEGLATFKDSFHVHLAKDGTQALAFLESMPVSLVVTDLRMPGMDGFQLMAHLRVNHPEVPIIVMSAFATTEVGERLKRIGVVEVLEKPLDFDMFTEAVLKGLAAPAPSGDLAGISMSGFLQLVEMERKTCSVGATGKDGASGVFFFDQGELVDARCGELRGEEAAVTMLGWDNPGLSFGQEEPEVADRSITSPLMSILLEGSRRKDEALEEAAQGLELAEFMLIDEDEGPGNPGPDNASDNHKTSEEQGRPTMAGLKPILKEMADEMDGVIALAVVGMDGILVAAHNPTGAEVEVMSAKFAMLLKLASRTAEDIKGMGEFEENLVQSRNAWVLARYLSQNYYLGIAVSRDGTLGNIRLVAQKYTDKLARAL